MTWKLVPVEPTLKMNKAGGWADADRLRTACGAEGIWSAMLSASPDPTTDEALVERVARALAARDGWDWKNMPPYREGYRSQARIAIRAMEEKP